ncbi:MAG: DUF1800 domain-containing protein [Leptothrix sp. (in: Bacteria)]|nr:DUF1800 domain-containing protein [Leptothrix sp. (in: b-proteobacteria)]
MNNASLAAVAAHRFGLGERSLAPVGDDPAGWLLAQRGPADPQRGSELTTVAQGLRKYAEFLARLREPANAARADAQATAAAQLRDVVQADVRARLGTAATSTRPFAERLALFWANHFTVSLAKNGVRGVVGAFEREAIRPHIAGRFETLLQAAVTHPGMLRYLDNDLSAGPDSTVVRRQAARPREPGMPGPRITGLNENLAREILELHTLGVAGGGAAYGGWGGYTQADVTAFAGVLTGWRIPVRELMQGADVAPSRFDGAWHQPGGKTVLGQRYGAGPEALPAVLRDLARHPSTARFVCSKLARHFVADDPPPALVARLEAAWRDSDGDLAAVTRSLVAAPEAWAPLPAKLKTPEEFVISSVRLLGLGAAPFARVADGGIGALGQRVQAAPSPAGWPDRADDWLGPDAVWKRVEWATRLSSRMGRQVDARALAAASLGPQLQASTARQVERAADGPQALALLLLAPEFQRR